LGANILKLYTSYRGDRFQVPTRQTGEYKVDVTRHQKFPLAFGELASGGFPHCSVISAGTIHDLRRVKVPGTDPL
jgi:hypothetical protein